MKEVSIADNQFATCLAPIEKYYGEKIREHGAIPKGVDWNGEESQQLRFEQLLRVCPHDTAFSLLDYGCGYGSLYDAMKKKFQHFTYHGLDISEDMIDAARKNYEQAGNASFDVGMQPKGTIDYIVASGVFNVRLETTDDAWWAYLLNTLELMNRFSDKGFAFNCLTKYSDKERMRDYLYYADPCRLFDYCKTYFSKNVALLHDYGLYEFTILVRKDI